jgi:hypothetical protein
MSIPLKQLLFLLGPSVVVGYVEPILAMGGGGPPISSMTKQYCTEQVVKKGITDVTRFIAEVQRCVDNPVTYPTANK